LIARYNKGLTLWEAVFALHRTNLIPYLLQFRRYFTFYSVSLKWCGQLLAPPWCLSRRSFNPYVSIITIAPTLNARLLTRHSIFSPPRGYIFECYVWILCSWLQMARIS